MQLITHGLGIGFMLQAWWLFVICSSIFVVASLLTQAPDADIVDKFCFSRSTVTEHQKWSISDPKFLSIALLVAITVLYVVFS